MTERKGMNSNGNDRNDAIINSWMTTNVDFAIPSKERLTALRDLWMSTTTSCYSLPVACSKEGGDEQQEENDSQVESNSGAVTTTATPKVLSALERWWDRLEKLHCEPKRAYHTLVHLEEMVGYLRLFPQLDSPSIVLAIFFHDAIYDPTSGTNEEDSAKLFRTFHTELSELTGRSTLDANDNQGHPAENQDHGGDGDGCWIKSVMDMILATKSHQCPGTDDSSQELCLLLDFDMAVLGKEPDAYDGYAGLIRREYSFVDRSTYCSKRADILESFLQVPFIFGTDDIRSALEDRARSNIQREMESLRKGVIPGEIQ